MPAFSQQLLAASEHLQRRDKVLRRIVQQVGPCRLKRKTDRFATLVHSIVAQQVSGHAARAIFRRLEERLGKAGITPDAIATLDLATLRELGVSRQKASYLLDLAAKTRAGLVRFDRFGRMPDEAIIEQLVQVKGVGRWTAQMLLIFSLGRLDVLPDADFGIRTAIRQHYQFADLPQRHEIQDVATPWRPYASVACWYLWRSLEPA